MMRSQGWSPCDGNSELIKSPQSPLTSSATWEHSEKTPSMNQGVCPQGTVSVLLPWTVSVLLP